MNLVRWENLAQFGSEKLGHLVPLVEENRKHGKLPFTIHHHSCAFWKRSHPSLFRDNVMFFLIFFLDSFKLLRSYAAVTMIFLISYAVCSC